LCVATVMASGVGLLVAPEERLHAYRDELEPERGSGAAVHGLPDPIRRGGPLPAFVLPESPQGQSAGAELRVSLASPTSSFYAGPASSFCATCNCGGENWSKQARLASGRRNRARHVIGDADDDPEICFKPFFGITLNISGFIQASREWRRRQELGQQLEHAGS